jgi:L-lactate dehydrogenase complex protein LldG
MTQSSSSSSPSRNAILGRIRKNLGRDSGPQDAPAEIVARLGNPPRNVIPARAQIPHDQQVNLFVKMAEDVNASVRRIDNNDAIVGEVSRYLAEHNQPAVVRLASDSFIAGLDWNKTTLEISTGIARPQDLVSVTPAFAGVAETGSLMLRSGPDQPYTLNMLPDTHIVVIRASQIVGTYEDVWGLQRQSQGRGTMPRTFLWVTGPSRTGDIEQTLQLGAHGPRRLHIILVDDAGNVTAEKAADKPV